LGQLAAYGVSGGAMAAANGGRDRTLPGLEQRLAGAGGGRGLGSETRFSLRITWVRVGEFYR
jgi:hypothetical protein